MKNSRRSRNSKTNSSGTPRVWDFFVAAAALGILSGAALWWCFSRGYLLYFGDAVSHINTARRLIDSRTPGFDQIGTPWLPLPHLLMVPFVANDEWWRSGLAGGIPSAICFVAGGLLLYSAARMAFDSPAAGAAAAAVFALNPNVLYMQSVPMTESVFLATLAGLLFSTIWFRRSQSTAAILIAALFSNAASLSRYDGWFLIPFIALYIFSASEHNRLRAAVVFSSIAALGPLAWLAHNAYYFGNPLEFYNGPYSAKAIYQRALDAGLQRYAGDHDWPKAGLYYFTAARLCAGLTLTGIGLIGVAAALIRRVVWPVALLLLPCAFYVLSMYSSGTPIFMPGLWPNSYYNTRYGLAAMPLLAFGGATIVALAPPRIRSISAVLVALIAVVPWLAYSNQDAWICWKESQVNSDARRAWTHQAALYMSEHYQPGQGIFTTFGDLSGVFEEAGIPIKETLYDGNNPAWLGAVARPNLFLHEEWAVARAGDSVATAVQKAGLKGPHYRLVQWIAVKNADVIEIYKRD